MSILAIFRRFPLLLLVVQTAACAQKSPPPTTAKHAPLVLVTGAAGGTFVEYRDQLAKLLSQATSTPVTTLRSGGTAKFYREIGVSVRSASP